MDKLYAQYLPFFELLKLNRKGDPVYDAVFYMGIDTEFKQISETSNRILSFQLTTVGEPGACNLFLPIAYNSSRLSLPELISSGIRSIGSLSIEDFRSRYAEQRILVIGIAHFAAAELSTMRDRDQDYITKRLTLIQKSPITDGHPIKLAVHGCAVDFHLFDTMLLTPAKYKSLDALSSLLGDSDQEKLPVSPFYKRNMDQFLRDRPDDFERYALRDSELCLKLFLLLQQTLNDVVYGEPVKLFRTISSAAVTAFLRENEWFSDYREGVSNELLA